MSLSWPRRSLLAVATAVVVAWSLVLPRATVAEPTPSLAGQLLVATPEMGDPRFEHAVILMVRQDQSGALGIVINRPVGEKTLGELLAALGDREPLDDAKQAEAKVQLHLGGPVQPEVCFVLHSADYRQTGTLDIDGRIMMTTSREAIRQIAKGAGPKQSLFAFGYAGWAPGQLEGELKRRSWVVAPADPALVFDMDRAKVWDTAYGRRTQDL
jgi:putative transcriptional regulator